MKSPIIKLVLALFVLAGVSGLYLQANLSFSPSLPAPIQSASMPTLAATANSGSQKNFSSTAPEPERPTAIAVGTLAPTFTPETALATASEDSLTSSDTSAPASTPQPNSAVQIAENSAETGTLIIPKMELNSDIVPVPIVNNQWQIEDLKQDVGLLAGGGRFPGDEKSMILAGHATTFWPIKGPFAKLPGLVPQDEIVYVYDNQEYRYKISRLVWAEPDNVNILNSNNGDQLILVTCGDYDYFVGRYDQRLVVLADLIDVKPLETTN